MIYSAVNFSLVALSPSLSYDHTRILNPNVASQDRA
jgi:hypothetical protein